VDADLGVEWRAFIERKRKEELDRIIVDENLDPEATRAYIEGAFRDGAIQQTGTGITRVLPPVSRFSPTGEHAAKKQTVVRRLSDFFERFFGLS
jgi:type I restriction enzyme R subunit